jgi:hypothetical protein
MLKDVHVLAECFDDPVMKAAALRAVLTNMPGIGYVGASGLAGFSDNNAIRTQKIHDNVYIVGDGTSAAGPGSYGPKSGNCRPSPGKPDIVYTAWKGLFFYFIYFIGLP